jgi:hypothetical protein
VFLSPTQRLNPGDRNTEEEMRMRRMSWRSTAAALLLAGLAAAPAAAQQTASLGSLITDATWLRIWNRIAIDASGLDHTPPAPGEQREFAEQLGPGRSARAMAIVHVAVFDALNSINPRFQSYTGIPNAPSNTSAKAAIAQAAHDTLVALFPAQTTRMNQALALALAVLPRGTARNNGVLVGKRAAAAILAQRADDGSQHDEPLVDVDWLTSDEPGHWRQDPISQIPLALGAHWSGVDLFVLESAEQFRTPPPPPLNSPEYTAAYNEVMRLGGDGDVTETERTPEQTQIGIYWAYDGTPSLCAPPRLYNQVALEIARVKATTNVLDLARLLALVNVAMADAGVAVWESKYFWDVWRPITGIRESDPGTGPSGLGDGNADTVGDVSFTPLGAPASNATQDFTPPFPAYPSGHAGFGGALFQTLRRYYRTDRIPFTFVSDEFNGVTVGSDGEVRPLVRRRFATLSQAEEENGQSRIYLGIHWAFDKTAGIAQGRKVADYVFDNAFRPLR